MLHNKEIEHLQFGLVHHFIILLHILQEIIMLYKISFTNKCLMDNGIIFGMDIKDLKKLVKLQDIYHLMVKHFVQPNSLKLHISQLLIIYTFLLVHQEQS